MDEEILTSFALTLSPVGDMLRDASGTFYGVADPTYLARGNAYGVVFRLQPPTADRLKWVMSILHTFSDRDGNRASGGLVQDASGALYGSRAQGGAHFNGSVFRLTPPAGGRGEWHATDSFYPTPLDGATPLTPPIPVRSAEGAIHLFGVTNEGGIPNEGYNEGTGVVYEVVP